MRQRQDIFINDDDQIQCVHNFHSGPAVELGPKGETADVRIHLSPDRLRRLVDVGRAYLLAHDLEAATYPESIDH